MNSTVPSPGCSEACNAGQTRFADTTSPVDEEYVSLFIRVYIAGNDIPLASKLISVTDAFDSLMTDRPYRKGTSTEAALRELDRCKGTQFDPVTFEAFRKTVQNDSKYMTN